MLELLFAGVVILIVAIGVLRMASKAYWKYQIALLKAKESKFDWKQMLFGAPPQEYLDLIKELHEKKEKGKRSVKAKTGQIVAVSPKPDDMQDDIPDIPDPDPNAVPDITLAEGEMKEMESAPVAESGEKPDAVPKRRGRPRKIESA
jgi:hypothetical protein